jgi:hypothetical protein
MDRTHELWYVFSGTDVIARFLAMPNPRWSDTQKVARSFLEEFSYIKWQMQRLQ